MDSGFDGGVPELPATRGKELGVNAQVLQSRSVKRTTRVPDRQMNASGICVTDHTLYSVVCLDHALRAVSWVIWWGPAQARIVHAARLLGSCGRTVNRLGLQSR